MFAMFCCLAGLASIGCGARIIVRSRRSLPTPAERVPQQAAPMPMLPPTPRVIRPRPRPQRIACGVSIGPDAPWYCDLVDGDGTIDVDVAVANTRVRRRIEVRGGAVAVRKRSVFAVEEPIGIDAAIDAEGMCVLRVAARDPCRAHIAMVKVSA